MIFLPVSLVLLEYMFSNHHHFNVSYVYTVSLFYMYKYIFVFERLVILC